MNKRGAPAGNRNALKHGKYTRERRALLATVRAHIQCGRALLAGLMPPPGAGLAAPKGQDSGRGGGTEGAKEWA